MRAARRCAAFNARGERRARGLVHIRQQHPGAVADESFGIGASQSRGGTRYDRDFAGETVHGCVLRETAGEER